MLTRERERERRHQEFVLKAEAPGDTVSTEPKLHSYHPMIGRMLWRRPRCGFWRWYADTPGSSICQRTTDPDRIQNTTRCKRPVEKSAGIYVLPWAVRCTGDAADLSQHFFVHVMKGLYSVHGRRGFGLVPVSGRQPRVDGAVCGQNVAIARQNCHDVIVSSNPTALLQQGS